MEPASSASRPTQEVAVRPTNLLSFAPEKEPLVFDVDLIGAPPEIEHLIQHIKAVAEQYLYHWKTFPISIPKPIFGISNNLAQVDSSEQCEYAQPQDNKKSRLNLRDLFMTPPFDELDVVALDAKGEPKRLTDTQLRTLKNRGEFEVPSLNFPGQVHRWRLSQLLQKGHSRAQESLLEDLARAAQLIYITAKRRIFGSCFSVAQSIQALLHGFIMLVDMTVGIPSLLAHDLEYKIKEERCRYLVAELICRPEYEECMESLCAYVRSQLRRATTEKFDVECMELPIPYLFLTPKGLEIDLRLFSRDIMRKALPILVNILERERRGWFLHFRERLIAELRDKKMTDVEIEEEVNERVQSEYLQRVYSSILSHPDLANLGEKIPQLMVQQAQSVVIIHKAVERVQNDINRMRVEHQRYLINEHPILSKVKPWLQMKLELEEMSKTEKCMWSVYEEALKMSQKHNLQQTAYFLSRDLTFMREQEPVLQKELRKVKAPTRCFQWSCRIWSPKSWIVRRNFQGTSEIIQTVICQQATSIVTPRSDPSQPIFLVEKDVIRTNSTRWPFWRLLNLMQRIWCYTWNVMFLFGFIIPWDSPVGVRALFCIKPFMPALELSQVNGTLFPKKTSITQTLASRLIELWRHVSKARTRFETEPDTGFIGKGMTRATNQVWNYFFKGFIGTIGIIFIFPVVCLILSVCSIFLAISAPFWIPISLIFLHIYMIFVDDLDCPNSDRNRYCIFLEAIVGKILLQGCVQPILAVFVGGVLCPLAAVTVFLFGVIRYFVRLMWDSITFHVFIKKYGRVPSNDCFAVKRIAGPGLESDYHFSIKPEQALAAFEAKMELDELEAFQRVTENHILQPQNDLKQFVEACFGPFSSQLNTKSITYKNLERESRDLLSLLNEKLEKRRRELQINLHSSIKNRIKLRTFDLRIAIQHGAHLLERFYPKHVINRLSISDEDFWDSRGLQIGDWAGLAGSLYTDIFSLNFLTPLSESDTKFKLEPHAQLDLTRYIKMVQSASDTTGINGPDLLGNVYAPRGNIQVKSPYLEVSAFNPRTNGATSFKNKSDKRFDTCLESTQIQRNQSSSGNNNNSLLARYIRFPWKNWKPKYDEKLTVPKKILSTLPIPHPVHIAIGIYNRDNEDPIPMNDKICWDILNAVEEYNGDIQTSNLVARYRGGGGLESGMTTGESSIDSLNVDDNDDNQSMATKCTQAIQERIAEDYDNAETEANIQKNANKKQSVKSFQWTLSNWGSMQGRNHNATGTIRVDLASPEDVSLDTDNSSRVVFSTYGTTV